MLPEIANPPIALLGDDASTLGPKSVREKFEKGLSFLQVLLSLPVDDMSGVTLEPATIGSGLLEVMDQSASLADLATNFGVEFDSFVTDSEGSRDYITKAVDMSDLSPTLITYLFKLNVTSSPLLKDADNIKKNVQLVGLLTSTSQIFSL